MPSTGAFIGGSITLVIGLFIFTFFKDYGDLTYERDFRYPWESWQGPGFYHIGSFFLGIILIGMALNTLGMTGFSILILIPAITITAHYKSLGHILAVVVSSKDTPLTTIKKARYGLLAIGLTASAWAVYLSVRDW